MRKGLWLALAAGVVIAVGVTLIALPRGPEWTTSSPAALEEFQAGMEAQKKLYAREAEAHLERAVELDPDFVMAKMYYLDYVRREDPDRHAELLQEVLQADLDRLNDRERFMVQRRRLLHDDEYEQVVALIDTYLESHPEDPWVLYLKAMGTLSRGENDEAERLFRRLLEISPNWVIAYNQLGYITMRQGRFVEAEEYFTSYRFIAPDQANPHDSLGELFIILGRYHEAVQSLERALQIKPDFWATFEHLIQAHALLADWDGVERVLERLAQVEGVPESVGGQLSCLATAMRLDHDRQWRTMASELTSDDCLGSAGVEGAAIFYVHRAACMLEDWQLARELEERMSPNSPDEKTMGNESGYLVAHATGVRLAAQGELAEALAQLSSLDQKLRYYNSGLALLKLYNRLLMVEVLNAMARQAEAHKLLDQVRAVNPAVADEFQDHGLAILGLAASR